MSAESRVPVPSLHTLLHVVIVSICPHILPLRATPSGRKIPATSRQFSSAVRERKEKRQSAAACSSREANTNHGCIVLDECL